MIRMKRLSGKVLGSADAANKTGGKDDYIVKPFALHSFEWMTFGYSLILATEITTVISLVNDGR